MKKQARFLLLFISFICSNFHISFAKESLQVLSVVGDGENVNNLTQIAIQFNRPVILYGDKNNIKIPIEISPTVNCKWQWINDTLLTCYLTNKEKLHLSTTYNIKIPKDFKTFDGVGLNEDKSYKFTTLRPDIQYANVVAWKDSGKPVIRMNFNQIINIKNLEKVIFISGEKNKNIKIKLLDEKLYLAEYELKQYDENLQKLSPSLNKDENKEVIFIEPEENLTFNSEFKLIIDNGIVASDGPETIIGPKEVFSFKTFDRPKLLGISCSSFKDGRYEEIKIGAEDDFSETKKCLPGNGIRLNFSSPIMAAEALRYLTFTPDVPSDIKNHLYEPLGEKSEKGYQIYWDGSSYNINLYGSFLPNTTYKIQSLTSQNDELPNKLKNLFNFSKDKDKVFDIFGNEITQRINFEFAFDHHEPALFFPQNQEINVLEKSTETDLTITSRNFKEILIKYNLISSDAKSKNQIFSKNIEDADDVFVKTNLEIRKLLNGKSGLIFGELIGEPKNGGYPKINL